MEKLFPSPDPSGLPESPAGGFRAVVVGLREDADAAIAAFNAGLHVHPVEELTADTLARLVAPSPAASDPYARLGRLCAERVCEILARACATGDLTPREAEVAALLRKGYSNPRIAWALGIEPKTVWNRLVRVFDKLAVNSRFEAVARLQEGN